MIKEINRLKRSSAAGTSKLDDWIRKDEINEAYEFDITYDGTIDNYKKVVRLLDQTEEVSSRDIINATQLPVGKHVTNVTHAIEKTKPKLYGFIKGFMMNYEYAKGPKDLSELKMIIEK